jgi:hypothetical protein
MIAGELEGALNYNNFLSGKSKSAPDKPKMNLIQKAGKAIDKAGGVEGIGRTVDSVRSLFRKSAPATAPATDYQFGLKQNDATNNLQDEQNREKQKKEKQKLIITGVLVVSGIILIGGLIWYFNKQKQQALALNK